MRSQTQLPHRLKPMEMFMQITEEKSDWNLFSVEEKKTTASLMSLIKLVKLLIDQPVITEEGRICNEAYSTIEREEIGTLIQMKAKEA